MLNYSLIVGNERTEITVIALALAKGDVYVKPEGLAFFLSEHINSPL
jgi:hypothetical protein